MVSTGTHPVLVAQRLTTSPAHPHLFFVCLILQKLTLEAQLKAKEFAHRIQCEPVKYAEEPACQEVQPPYPAVMMERWRRGQEAPLAPQPVKRDHQVESPRALPSAEAPLLQPSPPVESTSARSEEAERLGQQAQPGALPGKEPCVSCPLVS